MPTPVRLASDVSAAEIAAAADLARAKHEADVAAQIAKDGQPPASAGEGWSVANWLKDQQVTQLIGQLLMRPLEDLETSAAFAGASTYPGSVELHFFRALGSKGSRAALVRLLETGHLLDTLADALWPKIQLLAQRGAATATELHNKFMDEGVGFDLEYLGLKSFFAGLEAVVGAPSPQVLEGMRRDHCENDDSTIPFETPNYKMVTTSKIEWWFVVDPERGLKEMRLESWPAERPDTLHGSAQGRREIPTSEFEAERANRNAQLRSLDAQPLEFEEFLGARLYTGPCFVKYNTTLRGLQSSIAWFKQTYAKLCRGNKYTTTLHVINSAVIKLSKLTMATYVYRGVSGGRLPKHFRIANEYGVRGGIDPAFMSTTLDRAVALTYAASSNGPGVVFSMRQGMVDRGADIGWLSQYPHEMEILFAPLTGLEIHSISVDGSVLVPEIRLSVNLNASTIEQVIGRRRKLLKDMGDNMAIEVSAGLSGSGFEGTSVRMLAYHLAKDALAQPVMWYNDEENFQLGVARVIDAKRAALDHQKRLRWLAPQPVELADHADAIVKLLRHDLSNVRCAALEALEKLTEAQLSPHGASVVPLLRDEEEAVRMAAVQTLRAMDSSTLASLAPTMQLTLEQAPPWKSEVRRAAVMALGLLEQGKLSQYTHAIVPRLDDPNAAVRTVCLEVLGKLSQGGLLPHVSSMMLKLEDEDEAVRLAAVATLGQVAASIGKGPIIARATHPRMGVREAAVLLLGKLEPKDLADRIGVVVDRIADVEVRVRAAALQTLQSLEPLELVKHVETAVRCLQDPSARVRIGAVDVMDKLLSWGRSSVAIGGHPLETTREATLETMREATLETTLEATLETTHMLPSIKRYVPQLVHCLRDEDAIVRQRAISALLIVACIEDRDDGVRRAASLWATGKLGPGLLGLHAAAIATRLDDPILSVRLSAVGALAHLAKPPDGDSTLL
ncbi:pbs lyase heat-like repeat protein [Chrysochromulina tobinii]|uniref:NAD(P)(+)--arginine ADP-ribosyltransferase n=1 Tax=Chrysochromulina tobinii TaxID=1460289 RepID=A0A0M0JDZ3_9EUKA|nr:pbs lyase heat-like repeat protein [Chrysochromulina tobinii]|eukprot:KOO24567.1 pbs lyase heat-like repeat protein [Chrysochromulina sp. CCMP291]